MPDSKKKKYKEDNYLDIETLLVKYEPLRKSIFRLFSKYDNLWKSADDYEDLHQQIDYEFMRLCSEYDPTVGVDFTGYIKSHLQQRVYHYVTKVQNTRRREGNVYVVVDKDGDLNDSIDFNNITSEIADEHASKELRRIEVLSSLKMDEVPDKYKSLVKGLLYDNKSLEELAEEEGTTVRNLKLRLNSACEYFVNDFNEREMYDMYRLKHPFIYNRIPFIKRVSITTRVPVIRVQIVLNKK